MTDEFSKKQTGVLMQSIVSKLISYTLIQVNIYQFIFFSIVYFNDEKISEKFTKMVKRNINTGVIKHSSLI